MDAALVVRGHDTISTCVRMGKIEKAIALYLAAHASVNLPIDPLSMLGSIYTDTYVAKRVDQRLTLSQEIPTLAIEPKTRLRLLPRLRGGRDVGGPLASKGSSNPTQPES